MEATSGYGMARPRVVASVRSPVAPRMATTSSPASSPSPHMPRTGGHSRGAGGRRGADLEATASGGRPSVRTAVLDGRSGMARTVSTSTGTTSPAPARPVDADSRPTASIAVRPARSTTSRRSRAPSISPRSRPNGSIPASSSACRRSIVAARHRRAVARSGVVARPCT